MTKKNLPKPTTLDDLAAIINQCFTETQQYLDKRLGGMDLRLGTMDQHMDDMKGVLKDMV